MNAFTIEAPVTPQGISYTPILLYLTYAVYTTAAFLTARTLDSYLRAFVSISTFSPYAVVNPRPITRGHLWLAFALTFLCDRASVYSRLQRAVSVPEIALRFFQRSIRGSVSGRYPFIPLLGVSVRENSVFPVVFTFVQAAARLKFVRQRVAAR